MPVIKTRKGAVNLVAVDLSEKINWDYYVFAQSIAEAIEAAMGIDVTIIDNNRNRIAGTGYYTWTPPATLKAGSGYQIQIQNLTISDVTLSGVFSIAVGGKVEVSEHLLPGDTVPLGQYHEAAK
ncbi:MAG: hypothetical protein EOM17_16680, partial [Synergistales bacterium]|nr:hypothetical protein [Synergistales bacterium]